MHRSVRRPAEIPNRGPSLTERVLPRCRWRPIMHHGEERVQDARTVTKKAGPESPASFHTSKPKLWGEQGEASLGFEANNSERPGRFYSGDGRTAERPRSLRHGVVCREACRSSSGEFREPRTDGDAARGAPRCAPCGIYTVMRHSQKLAKLRCSGFRAFSFRPQALLFRLPT